MEPPSYYQRHREAILQKQKEYNEKNKAYMKHYNHQYYLQKLKGKRPPKLSTLKLSKPKKVKIPKEPQGVPLQTFKDDTKEPEKLNMMILRTPVSVSFN